MGALLQMGHRVARARADADGALSMSGITPSQTVGPFFAYGLSPTKRYDWTDLVINNLVTPDATGDRIRIEGRVTDADAQPINDALIEIWQADAQGRYAHPRDQRAGANTSF